MKTIIGIICLCFALNASGADRLRFITAHVFYNHTNKAIVMPIRTFVMRGEHSVRKKYDKTSMVRSYGGTYCTNDGHTWYNIRIVTFAPNSTMIMAER